MFSFAETPHCDEACFRKGYHTVDCIFDQTQDLPMFRKTKPDNYSKKKGKKNVRPA